MPDYSYNKDYPFAAFITNLGKYNEGELVGERPGLGQSESMSCYGVYRPTAATLESDRSVISNIHREGTPPVEAAAVIVDLVCQMMQHKASGIALNKALNPGFSG